MFLSIIDNANPPRVTLTINQPIVLKKLRIEKIFHSLPNTNLEIFIWSVLNLGPIEVAIPNIIDPVIFPKNKARIAKVGGRPRKAGIKPMAYFATAVFEENHKVKIDLGFISSIRTHVRWTIKILITMKTNSP